MIGDVADSASIYSMVIQQLPPAIYDIIIKGVFKQEAS
jgi:hypothetical protein